MNKKQLEEFTNMHIVPLFAEDDIQIYDQEYVTEDERRILRFYIEKNDGYVGIDDCEFASGKISDILDVLDPIEDSYYLEVSSPGIDCPFKKESDFEKHIGENIVIKFYGKHEGAKEWVCRLQEFDKDYVTVEYLDQIVQVERSKIATVRLSI